MQYMGSKNRLSKELVPIIQSYINEETTGYLEPFVGGANIIDKIECKKRIGSDINKYLIELLKHIRDDGEIPNTILKDEYDEVRNNQSIYSLAYVGMVAFCSFGNKMWGGYAKNNKNDTYGERAKSYCDNLRKQQPNLKNIIFLNKSFLDLPKDDINGYVIYCDPPYRDTTKYKTEKFPYEEFYIWCKEMSKNNIVLISEYNMPNSFECIWQKETATRISNNRRQKDSKNVRVEKLFVCK